MRSRKSSFLSLRRRCRKRRKRPNKGFANVYNYLPLTRESRVATTRPPITPAVAAAIVSFPSTASFARER